MDRFLVGLDRFPGGPHSAPASFLRCRHCSKSMTFEPRNHRRPPCRSEAGNPYGKSLRHILPRHVESSEESLVPALVDLQLHRLLSRLREATLSHPWDSLSHRWDTSVPSVGNRSLFLFYLVLKFIILTACLPSRLTLINPNLTSSLTALARLGRQMP